jgi:hypothetical protein
MREYGIRFVQVARHGHLEADGITILEDSRTPQRVYLEGDYRLSDELRSNGTVPQFGGEHRCSMKFKAFVIETWMKANLDGSIRHAFGYNVDEPLRIEKCQAATANRVAFGFNNEEQARIDRMNGNGRARIASIICNRSSVSCGRKAPASNAPSTRSRLRLSNVTGCTLSRLPTP